MIGVTLRGLLSRWRRAVLTSLAAVVGVAIVSGTLMVSDTAGRAGTADSDIDLVRQIMLIAGGVALLVGAFIVNLTTSVTVAQRTRELGLLRCIGADRGQLRRSVLLESSLIGLVAALAGLAFGYGVAIVLRMLINNGPLPGHLPGGLLVVSARTVAAAVVVGCLATMLSALAPARRAGRVSPMAALRDPSPPTGRVHAWRVVCGALTMAAGLALLPIAVATWRGPLLSAAVLVLVGVRLLGPVFASRLARVVGRPVAATFGVPGSLGRQNAVRSPERVAATASALMIGIALLTLVTVVSASAEAPLLADYQRDHADLRLTMTGENQTETGAQPMDPAVLARLRSLPQLDTVVTVDCVGDPAKDGQICAADPSSLSKVLDLEVLSGSLTGLSTGGVGLDQAAATEAGVRVGSTLRLGAASFTVRAVYRSTGNFRGYLMVPAELTRVGGHPAPTTALVRVAAGVPFGDARAAVVTAVAGDRNIELQDRDEFHGQDLAAIRGPGSVLRTLTGLAALVGLFGIAITLALSTVERRRELGLLRAVGMQRRQVRTMVRAEAVIVALVGTVPGLGVGVLFGWATAGVLEHSAHPTVFTIPYAWLFVIGALGAAAGVPAAALPARLAGRVDVLRALAAE